MSQLAFTSLPLPVSKKLYALLNARYSAHLLNNETPSTSRHVVFNFRDKSYSADAGGFHPVEISIASLQQEYGVLSTSRTLLIWGATTLSLSGIWILTFALVNALPATTAGFQ